LQPASGELNNEVIYVGGAVISLYVTDEGGELPRPTKDIDISVQISSYPQMDQLRELLANKIIYPAPTETILYCTFCRFFMILQTILVIIVWISVVMMISKQPMRILFNIALSMYPVF